MMMIAMMMIMMMMKISMNVMMMMMLMMAMTNDDVLGDLGVHDAPGLGVDRQRPLKTIPLSLRRI
jgi:hypothetical protein